MTFTIDAVTNSQEFHEQGMAETRVPDALIDTYGYGAMKGYVTELEKGHSVWCQEAKCHVCAIVASMKGVVRAVDAANSQADAR